MLHIHAALVKPDANKPPCMAAEDAKRLFHATVRDARAPDGADGIAVPLIG